MSSRVADQLAFVVASRDVVVTPHDNRTDGNVAELCGDVGLFDRNLHNLFVCHVLSLSWVVEIARPIDDRLDNDGPDSRLERRAESRAALGAVPARCRLFPLVDRCSSGPCEAEEHNYRSS